LTGYLNQFKTQMKMKYLLDTNAFWKVLESWNSKNGSDLDTYIKKSLKYSFYLSEISAMEIHSVLGKYIRGKLRQEIKCTRLIKNVVTDSVCNNIWISPRQRALNRREAKVYIQLINDILNNRHDDFEIEILNIDSNIVSTGRQLLEKHAHKQDLHSLDATIAAAAVEKSKTIDLTVITFDRKLRNILSIEGIKNCP